MSSLSDDELNSILGNTTSYQIYKKFDEEKDLEEHNTLCKEFRSLNEKKDGNGEKTCKKIAKNLKKLSDLASTVKYRDRCLHYKYWIYDQIWKESNKEGNDVGSVINKFLNIQTSVTKSLGKYYCPYNFHRRNLTELREFREEKHLYEYFKHYNTLNRQISTSDANEETYSKYLKYLEYIKDIYIKHKNDSCCDYYGLIGNCYHYFKCEEDYNPNNLLCKLKKNKDSSGCNLENKGLPGSDIQRNGQEDSNLDKEIKPQYFSCKEIKSSEGVPFLSCFVLRTGSQNSDKATQIVTTGPVKTYAGYISDAIKSIQNSECNEIRKNGQDISYECKTKKDLQLSKNGVGAEIKKEDSLKDNDQLDDNSAASIKDTQNNFRWRIDETVMRCPAHPSDNLGQQLCGHISNLRKQGKIGKSPTAKKLQPPVVVSVSDSNLLSEQEEQIRREKEPCVSSAGEINLKHCKNFAELNELVHSAKTASFGKLKLDINDLLSYDLSQELTKAINEIKSSDCKPKEKVFCQNLYNNAISEIRKIISQIKEEISKIKTSHQGNNETVSITETEYDTQPDDSYKSPSILEQIDSIMKSLYWIGKMV
ncbi:Plasmodium vivax Vir protein, putative [Plasmodium vivax]|uniref:Vir protein, putative n=1 Tax=Plasmodium vivax TaxID=5855 RepID=A0A1G4E911_PLAVI|nr:Plasmodium vivax Vir protein, putative [Plasmodium vivax]